MEFLYSIWIFGVIVSTIYYCFQFSKEIKVLKRTSSACFLGLECLKDICKGLAWPITLALTALQYPFAKGIIEDSNEVLAEYMGYDLEDDDSEDDL